MITVNVLSPVTYRKFKKYFPDSFPAEHLLYEQHIHRYKMFVDFLGWRSKHIYRDERLKIECDAYDRQNTIYSIATDAHFKFIGSVRANSTLNPYMLEEDEFQDTCYPNFQLPKKENVFEGTRIINANSKLYADPRQTISTNKLASILLLSHLELAQALHVDNYIGTMPPVLLDKVYGRMGWDIQRIGPPSVIADENDNPLDKGQATQNYMYPVNDNIEDKVRQTTGHFNKVSNFGVSPDILPDLLEHMKEAVLSEYPHRFPLLATALSPQFTQSKQRKLKPL